MLVARKKYDAAAAVCAGGAVVLIATGLKPVPAVIGYLGVMAYVWAALMVIGSLAAAIGSLLRTRDTTQERRRYVSVVLERDGWLIIAGCALIFCIGVVYQFGLVNAAQTLGWTGFVIFSCLGHWRAIHLAAKGTL